MSGVNLIRIEEARTLDGLFYARTQRSADETAYIQYNRKTKSWEKFTWNEMAILVGKWQKAILDEHLERGQRVAILMKNCREWVAVDQASLALGLVVVPLYQDDRPDNIAYILEDSAVKLLVVQDLGQWKLLRENCRNNTLLQRIVLLDTPHDQLPADELEIVITAAQWLPDEGHALLKRNGDPRELATIVYTSGTTGRPKGVMLNHNNILSVAYLSGKALKIRDDDTFLSFLPISHTFERSLGYYLTIMAGSKVAFARSIQGMADDLISIKPTLLISVPRIYERFYAKIESSLLKGSMINKLIFKLAVQVGWNRFQYHQRRKFICLSCILWPILRPLVADKVMEKFGGRLRMAATGGAAIPFPVAKTFIGLGLTLIQGYGLTETSPVCAANRIDDNDPRSIGLPLEEMEMRIGKNDELLIKTPGLMMGYWNNHTATSEAIDAYGWFHSGDQARIDPKTGHVYITGRIKDVLVMSNGEKIPPTDIENTITMDPLFDNALLLGEAQPYLGAILVINSEHWVALAKTHKLDPFDKTNINDKAIQNYIVRHLRDVLHDFPGYAKIRKVHLTLDPWTVDNDLLTPTLKVKRPRVMELFKDEIASLYNK